MCVVYVGTVYCRLAIIKCRENIEKYKPSLIEYGDENIQFRVPESTETERRKTEIFVSCIMFENTKYNPSIETVKIDASWYVEVDEPKGENDIFILSCVCNT